MNRYEEKRQAKADYFRDKAQRLNRESENTMNTARRMAEVIPFGQPILVGHHSEKRDRNYRNRIHNQFGKSFELSNKAKYYEQKANTVENNTAIFSDDPEAVVKLKEKISEAEKSQEIMKKCNAIIRKKISDEEKVAQIIKFTGFKEETVAKMLIPDFCGRIGFPSYSLTNNNANISRMKKRLAELQIKQNQETTESEVNGIKIVENVEDNRCQIFFPGIPDVSVRKFLKSRGFRWSRYNGCWQRHRSSIATRYAEQVQRG